MTNTLDFIVYAPSFHEETGGIVVLHYLCEKLRRLGCRVTMWPDMRPLPHEVTLLKPRKLLSSVTGSYMRNFSTGPWHPRMATLRDLKHGLVIYPEVIDGNPLGATRVARWLLHKEGYFGNSRVGADDLVFYYNPAFLGERDPDSVGGSLAVTYIPEEYGRGGRLPRTDREGSCFLNRKHGGQSTMHPPDAIGIDGLSHAATSEVMRRSSILYSYDLYTMYNYFAALEGCVPLVVPVDGLSEEEWQPDVEMRYGLAYGEERIDFAIATRDLLVDRFKKIEDANDREIAAFVDRCRQHFA